MTRRLTGKLTDITVRPYEEVHVNGAVTNLTVKTRGNVTINGRLNGRLVVEPDGALVVNGMLDGDVEVINAGFVGVAGLADIDSVTLASLGEGLFAMSPGSMLKREVLKADGSLAQVTGDVSLEVDASKWCAWDPKTGVFVSGAAPSEG